MQETFDHSYLASVLDRIPEEVSEKAHWLAVNCCAALEVESDCTVFNVSMLYMFGTDTLPRAIASE
jgi:hypothetical protein